MRVGYAAKQKQSETGHELAFGAPRANPNSATAPQLCALSAHEKDQLDPNCQWITGQGRVICGNLVRLEAEGQQRFKQGHNCGQRIKPCCCTCLPKVNG